MNNKMAINIYLLTVTLNANGIVLQRKDIPTLTAQIMKQGLPIDPCVVYKIVTSDQNTHTN